MKKIIFLLLFSITAFSFAQQRSSVFFNQKNSEQDLLSKNTTKYSLNMSAFKFKIADDQTNVLPSKSFRKLHFQHAKPIDNMPIFTPDGNFFFKVYKVEENIDHKLRIFDFEKSKHYWKSVG